MTLITRDISQSITTMGGQICEIEASKYVVLKLKGYVPKNRIEVLIEKIDKLGDNAYQGKIRGFKREYGELLVREYEQDDKEQGDTVSFRKDKIFRIQGPTE